MHEGAQTIVRNRTVLTLISRGCFYSLLCKSDCFYVIQIINDTCKIRLVVKFPKQVALLSLGRVNTPLRCESVEGFLISKKGALSDSLVTE